jgi:hypothetical protein
LVDGCGEQRPEKMGRFPADAGEVGDENLAAQDGVEVEHRLLPEHSANRRVGAKLSDLVLYRRDGFILEALGVCLELGFPVVADERVGASFEALCAVAVVR